MDSFNHYADGSVGEWMFSSLAGIDTDGPGFRRLIIHPCPGCSVPHAKAEHDSINGRVRIAWELKGTTFSLRTSIRCNTLATVFLPATNAEAVAEGGKPACSEPGVKFLRMDEGKAVFEIGSGEYDFRVE